jgi:CRP-like cAMP-binding protein
MAVRMAIFSKNHKQKPAEDNMLLAALPRAERKRLDNFLHRATVDQDKILISPNEPIQDMWFPIDAITSTLQTLQNGMSVESGLMGLEGVVGIQFWLHAETTPTRTVIQVPGTALRMSTKDFKREVMDTESPLNLLIAKYVHGFLNMTSQTAACNRMHEIDERLCRWLRMIHDRLPGREEFPLRQEFMAEMLGVHRPTISTAAAMLQEARFIEYSRGKLRILDPEGLKEGACECYGIIEQQFDRIFEVPWRPK